MNITVCLSGGLDSTVLSASLLQQGHTVRAVSFAYGQRHASTELAAAGRVAAALGIEHRVLDLTGVTGHMDPASSQLLAANPAPAVPSGHYSHASMQATVVPGRNLLMVAAAVAYAASHGCEGVALAAHTGDHPIYRDCRPDFLNAAAQATSLGYGVELLFPLADHTKTDIAALGDRLGAPVHLSWSCYNGGAVHCGRCGTCVERYEAFRDAGVSDPTDYAEVSFAQEVTTR